MLAGLACYHATDEPVGKVADPAGAASSTIRSALGSRARVQPGGALSEPLMVGGAGARRALFL